ncbi:MAG: hypothetical protein IRZ14_09110 [Chloroflexi bacterium]|jgi:hypothetical protein|nr:hypothetical protein [Chloroflexota bacterium]
MNVELTQEESTLLANLLDQAIRDLKAEIHHTDTPGYKEQLKEREALMVGLLRKLGATPSA